MAVGEDQHHQRPVGGEADELDMPDRRLVLGREHHRGAPGDRGERGADAVEQGGDVAVVGPERGVELLAVGIGRATVVDFEQPVDEEAQPHLCRHPPGRDMRAVQQPQEFEVLHHVADGRGRDLLAHAAGQRARADRIAGVEIALDHAAKHLARAIVEFGEDLACVLHLRAPWPL
jgi:hypothetical protein